MEDKRFDEFENETAMSEYENGVPADICDDEGGSGIGTKLLVGGIALGVTGAGILIAKRKAIAKWLKDRKIAKAKKIMMDNGYGIVDQSVLINNDDAESEEDSETEE